MNWMQVEEYLRARRPRRAAARQHRAARLPAPHGRLHPPRARRRRGRRAARRAGVSRSSPYGVTPYFREFPGIDLAARRDAPARRARHPRQHGAQRLSPHPDRQRPRRQRRRAAVRAGVDGRSSRLPRDLPQLVERAADVGQGAGDRSGRVARVVDGELSVDAAARASRMPDDAAADGRSRARARCSIPSRCARYLGDGNYGGLLSAVRRGHARALAGRGRGDARAARRARGARRSGRRDAISHLGRRRDRRHDGRATSRAPATTSRWSTRSTSTSRRSTRAASASPDRSPSSRSARAGVHAGRRCTASGTRSSSRPRRITPRRPRARSRRT